MEKNHIPIYLWTRVIVKLTGGAAPFSLCFLNPRPKSHARAGVSSATYSVAVQCGVLDRFLSVPTQKKIEGLATQDHGVI